MQLQNENAMREMDAVVKRWGVWTDHNIQIADNVFTIGEAIVSEKVRRVLQVVADLAGKPFSEIRVLDLACLEGQYAVEFARHGARAVAIEGREANFEKASFAKRMLSLDNLELIRGDVRDLSREKHGVFDVVLCLGILYHLDVPDVFAFVENIAAVCGRLAVFDTYVSLIPKHVYSYKDQQYWGRDIEEHVATETWADRQAKLWSSIDNLKSVWFTKPTLLNLLSRAGFTSVYECDVPVETGKPIDRKTIIAIKGRPMQVLTSPATNRAKPASTPEKPVRITSPYQRPFADLRRAITYAIPSRLRQGVKGALIAARVIRKPGPIWLR